MKLLWYLNSWRVLEVLQSLLVTIVLPLYSFNSVVFQFFLTKKCSEPFLASGTFFNCISHHHNIKEKLDSFWLYNFALPCFVIFEEGAASIFAIKYWKEKVFFTTRGLFQVFNHFWTQGEKIRYASGECLSLKPVNQLQLFIVLYSRGLFLRLAGFKLTNELLWNRSRVGNIIWDYFGLGGFCDLFLYFIWMFSIRKWFYFAFCTLFGHSTLDLMRKVCDSWKSWHDATHPSALK